MSTSIEERLADAYRSARDLVAAYEAGDVQEVFSATTTINALGSFMAEEWTADQWSGGDPLARYREWAEDTREGRLEWVTDTESTD